MHRSKITMFESESSIKEKVPTTISSYIMEKHFVTSREYKTKLQGEN